MLQGWMITMFGSDAISSSPLDSIAHIIQIALTPVFLLSGIAALLNVFSSRLARVADRFDLLTQAIERASPEAGRRLGAQLAFLRRRSLTLDAAVVLGTLGGGATCGAALALFVGALRNGTTAGLLFFCFGLALACTIGALVAFLAEVLMASRGLRLEVELRRSEMRESGTDAEAEPKPYPGSDPIAAGPSPAS